MKKLKLSALDLTPSEILTREQLKYIGGGMETWCRRRSTNVEDRRGENGGSGGSIPTNEEGFLNHNGCWIYSGMPYNAHPGCGPSSPNYFWAMHNGTDC